MILIADKELPDEIPEGFHYFMFAVEKDGKTVACGCFIGQSHEDIFEMPGIGEYAGYPVEVFEIDRAAYIEGYTLKKAENMKNTVGSVNRDSPAA